VKRQPNLLLAALLCGSVTVFTADTLGTWWWRETAADLAITPANGAARLANGGMLWVPAAVQRSRWLVSSDLIGAEASTIVAGLNRLGGLQRRLFPADPEGFKNGARAALVDNRVTEANRQLEEALLRDPSSPRLHRLVALVRFETGQRDVCLEHLADAESLAPGLRSPAVEVLPDEEKWIRLEGLRRRLDRYPRQRVATILTLAEEYRRGGLGERGRAMLEREIPHPEVELSLARWDRRDEKYRESADRLQALIDRRSYPAALRARAWALMAEVRDLQGNEDGAREAAEHALQLDPSSAAPYLALASLAENRGEWERALGHLRSAWGLAPTDTRLLLRIARVAEKADEPHDAQLALERAVQLEPASPVVAARLVDFLLRHGEYYEATVRLTGFLDRFPTDARLLRLADKINREVTRR
jgi:Tfp pilus assembly protein PilF